MLVLSRKVGERFLVGDTVIITVVRIGQNAVRLGISAPSDINIVREELSVGPVPGVCVLGPLADLLMEMKAEAAPC